MPNTAIASISRLVAIGLRMKISETFMLRSALLFSAARRRPTGSADPDAAPRHQAQGALRDYLLSSTQPLVNDDILIDAGAGDHGPRFHRHILLDDIHKYAVLAGL